jgi:hypothetical protein
MHGKPEQTPCLIKGGPFFYDTTNHSHRQSHQNINALHNQSILQITTFNASYVPGYFTPGIQRQARANYVPGYFTPGIQHTAARNHLTE